MDPPSEIDGESSIMSKEEEETVLLLEKVTSPTYLKETAGDSSCCIFRIPQNLRRTDDKAYEPKIVSIGPYHRSDDKKHLKMIEEHKQIYLDYFVSMTTEHGVNLSHLVKVVSGLEPKIRDSYSENLEFNQQNLIKMMVLDGCFILMLFLVVSKKIEYKKQNDPIFKLRWILPTLRSDLLLLENQVPLFLLDDILKTSKLAPSTSLNQMAFSFFKYSLKKPDEFWEKHKNLGAKHLLDLIRKTFKPFTSRPTTQDQCSINVLSREKPKIIQVQISSPPQGIFSATKLQLRGIDFKKKENVDTPLDILFKNRILEISQLIMDDFVKSLLINCIAFEQFNMSCSGDMTSYATFMGCLINTEEDENLLVEKGIIEIGMSEQVSLLFKNIGKDVSFNIDNSYLGKVFEEVNQYTLQQSLVSTYVITSAPIGIPFTILQSFFAALSYFRPPKTN